MLSKENGRAGEDRDAASGVALLENTSCSKGHVDERERSGEGGVQDKARVKRSPLSCLNSHTRSSKDPGIRHGRLGTSREGHTTVDLSSAGPSRQDTPQQPAAVCHQGDTSVANNSGVGVQPLVGSTGTAALDPHTKSVSLPSWTCCRETRCRETCCREHGCGQRVREETPVQQNSKTAESCDHLSTLASSQEQLLPVQPSSSDVLAGVLQQQRDEVTLNVDDVIVSSCDTNDLLAELSYYEKL